MPSAAEARLAAAPFPLSGRGRLLVGIALAAAASWVVLGLSPMDLAPAGGGLRILGLFLGGAVSPAWTYEAEVVPAGTAPLLVKVAGSLRTTIVFAAAGMSLALVLGVVLGFLGATSWWADEATRAPGRRGGALRRLGFPLVYGLVRILIAGMRSVHELLWAVLFLAAFGLNSFSSRKGRGDPDVCTHREDQFQLATLPRPEIETDLLGMSADP